MWSGRRTFPRTPRTLLHAGASARGTLGRASNPSHPLGLPTLTKTVARSVLKPRRLRTPNAPSIRARKGERVGPRVSAISASVDRMAIFDVVDLSKSGTTRGGGAVAGTVDPAKLAADLANIRNELDPLLDDEEAGITLKSIVVKLAVSAEGKVAFIAKGAAEASIEVTFERS